MNRLGLCAAPAMAALLLLSSTSIAADHAVVQADAVKWAAGPPALPKGAQIALLYGHPAKEGPFAYRLKFPAGYKIAAHTHPVDENLTVLSGTFHVGMGEKLDDKKGEAVKAGGAVLMPKSMPHYAWTTEETVIQLNGVGPAGITYVNPADDPSKTN